MALKGISGTLASADLLEDLAAESLPHGPAARRRSRRPARVLGPASSARHVCDALVLPLLAAVDLDAHVVSDAAAVVLLSIRAGGRRMAHGAVSGWDGDLQRLRERSVRERRASSARWWIGVNGPALRVVDATRAYSRRCIDVDLAIAETDDRALAALHAMFGAGGADALRRSRRAGPRHPIGTAPRSARRCRRASRRRCRGS